MKLSEFKVGDRVRGEYDGGVYEGIITRVGKRFLTVKRDDGRIGSGFEDNWKCEERDGVVYSDLDHGEPLKKNNNLTKEKMNVIQTMKEALISEPARTLKKAGLFGEDLMPTTDAQDLYLKRLMEKDTEFIKEVEALLKEEK